jgi:hypothetical protein
MAVVRDREIKRSSDARGRAMSYVPQSCMMLSPHHNMKAVETKIRILEANDIDL